MAARGNSENKLIIVDCTMLYAEKVVTRLDSTRLDLLNLYSIAVF